jgi:hypothetical protein
VNEVPYYSIIEVQMELGAHRVYFEANAIPPDTILKWENERHYVAIDRDPYADLLESSLTASTRMVIPSLDK